MSKIDFESSYYKSENILKNTAMNLITKEDILHESGVISQNKKTLFMVKSCTKHHGILMKSLSLYRPQLLQLF